jgi:hypothetical protein
MLSALLALLLSACTTTAVTTPVETAQEQRPVQVFSPSMLPPGPALAQGYEYWLEPCAVMERRQQSLEEAGYQAVARFRDIDDPRGCVLLVRKQ